VKLLAWFSLIYQLFLLLLCLVIGSRPNQPKSFYFGFAVFIIALTFGILGWWSILLELGVIK